MMRVSVFLAVLALCGLCGCFDDEVRLAPQGDVLDQMPSDLPVPPNTHMISNLTSGRWYSMAVIQVPQEENPKLVMRFLKDELPKHGWTVKPAAGPPPMPKGEGISFSKAGFSGHAMAYKDDAWSGCKLVYEVKPEKKSVTDKDILPAATVTP